MDTLTRRQAPSLSTRSDATTDGAETRVVARRAWLPVHLTSGGWIWFGRAYDAVEQFEPDYGGWSTGHWIRVSAHQKDTAPMNCSGSPT